ncbi:LacI family DNA-binding transcriptional regulator [Candidatus Darwinibacter acetoxidans]|jgi:LacI family transcriptional regulator|nr:LacI family DNA-binding transcriptional regulator [Bacillota bacterium]
MAHWRLRDVARLSGVSVSTASRALNDRDDVSPQTKARVLAAAERLGYVPSSLAKGLWSGTTKTVGVVVTNITNSFYANVVAGVEDVMDAHGYNIVLNSTHEDPEREMRAIKLLLEQRVDGIILAPVESEPAAVDFLNKNGVPYVIVGRKARNADTNHVVCDDLKIGRMAARYLLDAGHERVLFINSARNYSAELRAEGFRSVFREHGAAWDEDMILPVFDPQQLPAIVNQVFDGTHLPSAVFCFCDDMAIDVMRVLRQRGLKIPQDVAVMGVDNLKVTELLDPPLTTIDTSKMQMGTSSAEILLRAMHNQDKDIEHIVLEPKLVKRVSA